MSNTLYIDTSKCMGCRGCEAACKSWNQLEAQVQPFNGNYQTKTDFANQTYTFVNMKETASDGRVRWLFGKRQCMHCTEATCIMVCPKNAIYRTPEGAVYLDQEKCIGCGYCVQNCPYGVPKLNTVTQKASKCNLCADRLANGLKPACTKTCPAGAIQFGDRQELVAEAKRRVGEIKSTFPAATIYGENEVGGSVLYVLTSAPSDYRLAPAGTQVPWEVKFWKNFARPVGQVAVGASALIVLAGVYFNYFQSNKESGVHTERSGK